MHAENKARLDAHYFSRDFLLEKGIYIRINKCTAPEFHTCIVVVVRFCRQIVTYQGYY